MNQLRLHSPFLAAALSVALGTAVPARAQEAMPSAARTRVLFLPLAAKGGVNADTAEQFSTVLVAEAGRLEGMDVLNARELEVALSQLATRQVAGCDSAGCAAELAGALNADQVVVGTLGFIGDEFLLTLSRIRQRDSVVLARVTERFPKDAPGRVLDAMPLVVHRLFGLAAPMSSATQAEPVGLAASPGAPPSVPAVPPAPATATPQEGTGGGTRKWLAIAAGALVGVAGVGLGGLTGSAGAASSLVALAANENPRLRAAVPVAYNRAVAQIVFPAGWVFTGVGAVVIFGSVVAAALVVTVSVLLLGAP